MIDIMKNAAGACFPLTENEIGEFAEMKGKGMHFWTKVFDAAGAGRLCVMEMKAMAGMMRMETGVFSPTELDGPLFSFDYIKAMGKETLIVELYDTTISHPTFEELAKIKERYADLPAYDPGKHWFDDMKLPVSDHKKGRKITDELYAMMRDYSQFYYLRLTECDPCDAEEKKKRNAEFADGLLQNGGPAVDTFRKMIGDEKTEAFLKECMFYCR